MRYALIRNGVVENIVLWDGEADLSLPEDVSAIDTDIAGVGWSWDPEDGFQPPVFNSGPVRVTKADFQRLLTPAERYAINALRKQIDGLAVEDYADPANSLMIAAEDVLLAFEQPAEFIELDHPDTYQGLMLFAYLGILTEARVNEIVVVH